MLKHRLVYSHVTDWRMINDKAHPIKGFAFAKRPLFISWTWHTKNSEKKIDVYMCFFPSAEIDVPCESTVPQA